MKKVVILLIATFCIFTVAGFALNRNLDANAYENNLIFETNYNEERLLHFKIYDSNNGNDPIKEIFSNQFELEFSCIYEDITKIEIVVNTEILSDYVEFVGIYVNGGSALLPDSENTYIVDVIDSDDLTKIFIEFKIDSLSISSECRDKYGGKVANPDIEFIKCYTDKAVVDDRIEYGQKLYVEILKTITFNGEKLLFNFENLYFNTKDENDNFLAHMIEETELVVKYEFMIDYTNFLSKYVFQDEIRLVAYYTQAYKFGLNVDSNLIINNPIIENKDTKTLVTNSNQFFASGTNFQITINLLNYVNLKKLSDERYDIEGIYDNIAIDGKKIIIDVSIINQNVNLVIHLDYVSFKINSEGSSGAQVLPDKNAFVYGEKIKITSFVENNSQEIKTWKINGIEVPKIGETANGISRTDADKVEIDTAVWYEKFGLDFVNFKSEITTGMKTNVLLAITLPVGFAVLSALVLMLIILQNSKTKKKIRILLEEQRQNELKFSGGNISIADQLREGKSLTVTDEDVKAEMKKRKAQAKTKAKHEDSNTDESDLD